MSTSSKYYRTTSSFGFTGRQCVCTKSTGWVVGGRSVCDILYLRFYFNYCIKYIYIANYHIQSCLTWLPFFYLQLLSVLGKRQRGHTKTEQHLMYRLKSAHIYIKHAPQRFMQTASCQCKNEANTNSIAAVCYHKI